VNKNVYNFYIGNIYYFHLEYNIVFDTRLLIHFFFKRTIHIIIELFLEEKYI